MTTPYADMVDILKHPVHHIDPDAGQRITGMITITHRHPGGVAAGTDFEEYVCDLPFPVKGYKATYTPDAALTADDTDYATLTLNKADGAGGARTALATINTKITGGTGDWTAGLKEDLGLDGNDKATLGQVLTWKKAKTGNGVAIPAGVLTVQLLIGE